MVVETHEDLEIWQRAFTLSKDIFELSMKFPKSETFSLTDQVRRASRSVCAQIAEAWQMRRYEASFIYRLTVGCAEAAETQSWIRSAEAALYITPDEANDLIASYFGLLRSINGVIKHSKKWCVNSVSEERRQYGEVEELDANYQG